jgi:NAD+ kinase
MATPIKIVLLARDQTERIQTVCRELHSFLEGQPDTQVLSSSVVEDFNPAAFDPDVIAVVGGDGAILRACRQLGRKQTRIVGVNMGRLGFLADLSPEEFCSEFPNVRSGNFETVEHLMFECSLENVAGETETFLGLNEAAISAETALQMIEIGLKIDDEPVTTYSCDGLILSTPVGSTAHSLSAGGPAIRQDLPVFVVTPICPHTLSNRPLIDHADRTYELTLPGARTGVVLVIDGQIRRNFGVGDRVIIRKAGVTFKLVKTHGHSYYKVLHDKLGWRGQPSYGDD